MLPLIIIASLGIIPGEVAVVEVVVSGKRCGDAAVDLAPDPVAIEARVLGECGLALIGLPRVVRDELPLIEVRALEGRARLDPRTLVVHVDVPPTRWSERVLSAARARPPLRLTRETPSFHLDFAPRVTTGGALGLSAEAGLRAYAVALSSGLEASDLRGFTRGLTRLTFDHQPTLLRFVAGDEAVVSDGLGGAAVLGGLTIHRTNDLDPERARTAAFGIRDVVTTPSELEVYVNGGLVQRTHVDPGPFRLEDVPRPAGPGQVSYVLRDAFGAQRTVVTPYYSAPGLLRAGEHELTYSVGMVRRMNEGASWAYVKPGLFGYHRYGLTSQVTLAGRFEASPDGVRGGPSISTAVAGGALELALGLAANERAPGGAGQVTYNHPGSLLSWSAYARVSSPTHAIEPLGTRDDTEPESQLRAGALVGLAIERWSTSLEAVAEANGDAVARGTLRFGVSGTVRDDLNVYGGWRGATDGRWELSLGVRWSIDDVHATGFDQTVEDADRATGHLRAERRILGRNGVGASVHAAVDQRELLVAGDAAVRAETPWGRASVRGSADGRGFDGQAELASSLVAVWGGGVFLTTPLAQGYALVEVPAQPDVRVYLDHHPVGTTDGAGLLLVPGLRPYETARLSIDPRDVSADAMLGALEQTLAVPPRGAARLSFDVRRARFVRGTITRGGQPVTMGRLIATCAGARSTSPIGQSGAFELDSPPDGTCTLALEGESCRATLVVAGAELLIEAGVVSCDEVPR